MSIGTLYRARVFGALLAISIAIAVAAAMLARVDEAWDAPSFGDRSAAVSRPRAARESPAAVGDETRQAGRDDDGDGVADDREDALAERFAPIVFHSADEVAYPVNVDWWLVRTALWFYDEAATPQLRLVRPAPLNQSTLAAPIDDRTAADSVSMTARSRMKKRSLFLADVAPQFRRGDPDPATWTTYVHAYPNRLDGITLQYWRPYAWNAAGSLSIDFSHGGDWEGIAVILDAAQTPVAVAFLQHAGIAYYSRNVTWEGTHPVVYAAVGSHTSEPRAASVGVPTIRQETWSGGRTRWPDGMQRPSGPLVNVGERTRPRNGQLFVQYPGLWGAPGRLFITSGYWGPAFNETDARCDDGAHAYRFIFGYPAAPASCPRIFMTAWCDQMASGPLDRDRECYPTLELP